ncbi:MAG: hypothetical protein CMJ32_07710, partial [Phycisphaerae bacterium]|nr:hypothetical protein [Phycisphaerae bacterium]
MNRRRGSNLLNLTTLAMVGVAVHGWTFLAHAQDASGPAIIEQDRVMTPAQVELSEALYAESAFSRETAALAYNLGVLAYRESDFEKARELFEIAAINADNALAADAMFNAGNATYAGVLGDLESSQEQVDPDGLDQALEHLDTALKFYLDSIEAEPGDRDSRINAEITHTLIQELKKIKKQQQQQQQQQDQQQQDQQQQDQQQQDQ